MITSDPAEAALMAAVCAAPADDAPRLAYADWAERAAGAEGAARAAYIRRTVKLYHQHQLDDIAALALLTDARKASWSNGVDGLGLLHHDFVRGFVAYVIADAGPLLASDVAARCPLQYLVVRRGAKDRLAELLAAGWMQDMISFDLANNGLTDGDAQTIARSDLRGLRWLSLDRNPVTWAAVETLAAATAAGQFPELHTLSLPFDIYDQGEGDLVTFRPELGKRLRATYGDLAWLTPRPAALGGALFA